LKRDAKVFHDRIIVSHTVSLFYKDLSSQCIHVEVLFLQEDYVLLLYQHFFLCTNEENSSSGGYLKIIFLQGLVSK